MDIYELALNFKKKRELQGISEDFLIKIIEKELEKRRYLYEKIEKAKNFKMLKRDKDFLYFFKEIRKTLHDIFGVFAPKDLEKIYEIIYDKDKSTKEKIIEILMINVSTKERLNFYSEIYSKIFIEDPIEIMDLASGLNPISIYLSDKKPKRYYFVDLSEDIIEINTIILKEIGIEPYGYVIDISDLNNDVIRRHYQYIFLWKTIPVLEKIDRKLPYNLLSVLDFDYLVVSFSQKSLGKMKGIGKYWRYWIKRVSNRLGYKIIKEFDIPYEFFVVIKKS